MRIIHFLFLFAFVMPFGLKANITTINGTADSSYIGKSIYFYEISDSFSGLKTLISKSVVASDGSFTLSIDLSDVSVAIINIDRVNALLYLKPGERYNAFFPKLPPEAIKTLNNTNQVDLIFNDLSPKDLNVLVSSFYNQLENFQANNFNIIFTKNFRPKLYELRKTCDSIYASTSVFMNDFVHFAFANTDNETGLNKKTLFEKYILNRKIDIKNPECANFIKTYFDNEFERFDLLSPKQGLKTIISQSKPTKELLEELKKSDFLKNDTLREIVAIYGLSQCYEQGIYSKNTLLRMIDEVGSLSSNSSIKILAQNYCTQLKRFDKGDLTYNFSLKDSKGIEKKLSSFTGKPTLLVIWATWSQVSLSEMRLLETIYPKYASELNMVNISIDDNLFEYNRFLSQNQTLKGTFLNYANDKYLLEGLNILSVPQFILVDAKGKYQSNYTPAPSAGLEDYLKKLFEKK